MSKSSDFGFFVDLVGAGREVDCGEEVFGRFGEVGGRGREGRVGVVIRSRGAAVIGEFGECGECCQQKKCE